MINRGNYRAPIFSTPGAADAFVACVLAACIKSQWILHAFCVLRNHYHLAIETPLGNLVSGVHWLQSTFGNRFNRFRGEHGRAFQGRYTAPLVEPGLHLRRVVNYIHLNPVMAGIVGIDRLHQFRWSSLRYFVRGNLNRPLPLSCADWLFHAGLTDSAEGWEEYRKRLHRLAGDREAQVQEEFESMCNPWAIGSEAFRVSMADELAKRELALDWGRNDLSEINRSDWKRRLATGMATLRVSADAIARDRKSATWKIALATWLKVQTSVSNRWLGENLNMGHPDAVSHMVCRQLRDPNLEVAQMCEQLFATNRG